MNTPKARPNPGSIQSYVGCALWNSVTTAVAQIHQAPWRVVMIKKEERVRILSENLWVRSSQFWATRVSDD